MHVQFLSCRRVKACVKTCGLTVFGCLALFGCSSKDLTKQSTLYYHAPAQAYNLYLGNTAVAGEPALRESCSEKGSSLEVIDAHGGYYKIDVINLLRPAVTLSDDTDTRAEQIVSYYAKLYSTAATRVKPETMTVSGTTHIYVPIQLAAKQVDGATLKPVVGMLTFKQGNFLYSIQHVQSFYKKAQMIAKLTTLRQAMEVPGYFKVDKDTRKKTKIANINESFGFIDIDANASDAQMAKWRKAARCF